ncbi:MAG: RluA family pseudouridine synthase [Chitinophagaceae bacterium]|nr:MAG: RluA family pseudouridine synthase [Chitinophagaceae bacterium]
MAMDENEILDDGFDANEELYQKLVYQTDKGQEPLRIDKYLMNRVEGATRNKIQQAIHDNLVLVNGDPIKPNFKVKGVMEIVVYSSNNPDTNEILPQNIPLKITYEDDQIIIVNKEPGMVVHPGSGNPDQTLLNAIAYHLQLQNPEITEETLPRFGLVHRIDKNTSGLLVMAKTDTAMRELAKQFYDHTVSRKYVALVWGDVQEDEGTIVAHVGRHQRFRKLFEAYPDGDHGKDAITHYKVLERFGYVTLVECVLETGRTHQIRVHMKFIGHPLFNDDFYGGDRIVKGTVYSKYKQFVDNCFEICSRQALHAKTLGFIHPGTQKPIYFDSEIPADLQTVIDKWRNYVQHNRSKMVGLDD